jgi:hypothetical protein
MQDVWQELNAGWRDARWSFYFAIGLLPCVFVAVLLSYLIEGGTTGTPSMLTWVLSVPAALVALFWAGLKDGLDGRLGRYVWMLTLLLVGYWLILALIRTHETERKARIRAGKHRVTVSATVEAESSGPTGLSPRFRLPRANIRWEDMVSG